MATTWNHVDAGPSIVLTGANLVSSVTVLGWNSVRSTTSRGSAKVYAEWLLGAQIVNGSAIGFADSSAAILATISGAVDNSVGLQMAPGGSAAILASGMFTLAAGSGFTLPAAPSGSVAMAALDPVNGYVWFGLNGSWFAGGNPAVGANPFVTFTPGAALFIATSQHSPSDAGTLRAAAMAQSYPAPTGFATWDTSAPSIIMPRARVLALTAPKVYVDATYGSDSNDGSAPYSASNPPGVGPLLTIQKAVDYAGKNLDLSPPLMWLTNYGHTAFGTRLGVPVIMAPNIGGPTYDLPDPVFLDGFGASGPITLMGDPANPQNYLISAKNQFQGLTAQDGALLNCVGFQIMADPATGVGCTLINGLRNGSITVGNVIFGGGAVAGGAMGAAGISHVSAIGNLALAGSAGYNSVFEAIEKSVITFADGITVMVSNAMPLGVVFNLSGSECEPEGSYPAWAGAGVSGSTGLKVQAQHGSKCGISLATIVPGAGTYVDSTSYLQP